MLSHVCAAEGQAGSLRKIAGQLRWQNILFRYDLCGYTVIHIYIHTHIYIYMCIQ